MPLTIVFWIAWLLLLLLLCISVVAWRAGGQDSPLPKACGCFIGLGWSREAYIGVGRGLSVTLPLLCPGKGTEQGSATVTPSAEVAVSELLTRWVSWSSPLRCSASTSKSISRGCWSEILRLNFPISFAVNKCRDRLWVDRFSASTMGGLYGPVS
jgi:hypothetical protein